MRSLVPFALALVFAACGESPAPPPARPNRPLLRVLAGDAKTGRPVNATDATSTPSPAPKIDREFVRRLALTKNFQLGNPVGATPAPDGKSVLFLRATARDKSQSLYEID